MPATLRRIEDALEVDLTTCSRGGDFMDTLAKVREMPGRKFHTEWVQKDNGQRYERKVWLLPDEPAIAERLVYAIQPHVDSSIVEWFTAAKQQHEEELVSQLPEDSTDLLIPWATERAPWQPQWIDKEHENEFVGLKAHQRAWVAAVCRKEEIRSILADDMGLGKTLQVISAIAEAALRLGLGSVVWDRDQEIGFSTAKAGPKLVVCPNSVKGVWAREITRWLGPDEGVQVIDGSSAKVRRGQIERAIAENGWIIVNYEQLRVVKERVRNRAGGMKTVTNMKEPLFEKTEWFAVVADEVHRAKNRNASQTKGLYRVGKKAHVKIKVGATGTPLMNSPDELWSPLHWLFPQEYTSYWRFFETYVDYTEGYFGKVITGVRNPDALRFELDGRLYRRTKAQVLDLPEKQRIVVPVDMGAKQRKLYAETESQLWIEVEKAIADGDADATKFVEAAAAGRNFYTLPNGAARTVRLRQVLSNPAILMWPDLEDLLRNMDAAVKVESAKMEAAEERIFDASHKQHIVFSEFVGSCYIFVERLRRKGISAEAFTGKINTRERTALEDRFQNHEFDVIVGTIGAMREGVTLTAADTQHWVELPWVPGWREQGEDRSHRIGQRNALTLFSYEGQGTVDDGKIAPTNRLKERIVSTVLPKDEIKETQL